MRIKSGSRFTLTVAILHLIVVQMIATLAWKAGAQNPELSGPFFWRPDYPGGPPVEGFWSNIVSPLRVWDGLWYKGIADFGYASAPTANPAFWPLYPSLMSGLSKLGNMPSEAAGWLISAIAFVSGLALVFEITKSSFSESIARKAVVLLAVFPTSFFFSAVYTESLFLFLSVATLLLGVKNHWICAGLVGLLAALTRSQGVFLVLPLVILLVQQRDRPWRELIPQFTSVFLPGVGPLIFMGILESQNIDRMAFVQVQSQWNRTQAWPWETAKCAIQGCQPLGTNNGAEWGWLKEVISRTNWDLIANPTFRSTAANSDTLELAITFWAICLALIGLWRLPLYLSAFIWPALIVPFFQPSDVHALMSLPRFVIVLFPLFIVAALMSEKVYRSIYIFTMGCSILMLAILTIQFSQWYWVS